LVITPEVDLAWQHGYLDGDRDIPTVPDGGNGPSFNVHRFSTGDDSAFAGVGFSDAVGRLSVYCFYNPDFGSGAIQSQTISGGVRLEF
jgi:hypothetical protein